MGSQRVVIVGGGFAGLAAARALCHYPIDVVLINRDNYYTFSPLLHQVATAELEPELIAYPIRKIIRKLRNVQFTKADVKCIDLADKFVVTDHRLIAYDFLILATGSTAKFSQVPGAYRYAFPLKSLQQGVNLRNHILSCFEQAACEVNPSKRQQLLTFTIVGGGSTGVEFAGSLIELIASLVKDYPHLDFHQVQVVILQTGNTILPQMPKCLRDYTKFQLQKMGVEVLVRSPVVEVTAEAVYLQDSRVIPTKTVVWTAGVQGNPLANTWGLPTTDNNQVAVQPTLQVAGYPQVYIAGDLAALDGLPMQVPVAMQQGTTAATNIYRQIQGKYPLPLRYRHLGTMAIIGRYSAVADLGKVRLTGFIAWCVWLAVHLVSLPSFRNQLLVLMNWVWMHLGGDRPVNLILPLHPVVNLSSDESDATRPQEIHVD